MKPDETVIEQWKEQHGDVYQISGDADDSDEQLTFYFRKPNRADLSRLAREFSKDMLKATNNLVFGCLLHPSQEVLKRMVDEKPGLILALGGELQKIIGSSQDFLSKRL